MACGLDHVYKLATVESIRKSQRLLKVPRAVLVYLTIRAPVVPLKALVLHAAGRLLWSDADGQVGRCVRNIAWQLLSMAGRKLKRLSLVTTACSDGDVS